MNFFYLVATWLFLITLVNSQNNFDCSSYVLSQFVLTPASIFYNPLPNSGKFVNTLGDYNECKRNESTKYYLLNTFYQEKQVFFQGFCIVNNCTLDNLNQNVTKSLNFVMALLLPGSNTSLISTQFIDPDQHSKSSLDGTAIAAIIILSIVFCLLLAGTLIDLYQSYQSKKSIKIYDYLGREIQRDESQSYVQMEQANNEQSNKRNNNLLTKLLLCFSVPSNLQKIFSNIDGPNIDKSLKLFNGIRALSMFWVILGHVFLLRVNAVVNIQDYSTELKTNFFVFIQVAEFAVDVFFFMGGFFAAFVLIDKMKHLAKENIFNSKVNFSLLGIFFHRIYRILPSYALTILFISGLGPYLSDGPLWESIQMQQVNNCRQDYWKNLIFIQNFWDFSCIGWGWYLATDMQIFLIIPFLIYVFIKVSKQTSYILQVSVIVVIWITTVIVCRVNDFKVAFFQTIDQPNFTKYYYEKPWIRGDVSIFGLIIGCIYKEYKKEKKYQFFQKYFDQTFYRWASYILGLFLINFIIFITKPLQYNYPDGFSYTGHIIYLTFDRFIFVLGLFFVIAPDLFTGKGLVLRFLGCNFLQPIGKLSYAIYLVHLQIILVVTSQTRQTLYMNNENFLYQTFGDALISIFAGLVLALAAESPLMGIEKILQSGSKRNEKEITQKLLKNDEATFLDNKESKINEQTTEKDKSQV